MCMRPEGSCQPCAERDTTGLCCPVKLSGVLSASFERTDKELLAHLEGATSHAGACLQGLVYRVCGHTLLACLRLSWRVQGAPACHILAVPTWRCSCSISRKAIGCPGPRAHTCTSASELLPMGTSRLSTGC